MPAHKERRELPYSAAQMYDLVADVGRYPEFLPWVAGVRIRSNGETEMIADMIVGFKSLREQFTSRVVKTPKSRICVDYLDGPLKQLHNEWHFTDRPEGGCAIDFSVAFTFRNRLFQQMAGQMFNKALLKMTNAFETRAHAIYGQPSGTSPFSGNSSSSAHSVA